MHSEFITYLLVTELNLMSQVNSVRALRFKRSMHLAQIRGLPLIESSSYSKPWTTDKL